MKKKMLISLFGLSVIGLGIFTACGSKDEVSAKDSDGKETITFINHKTDWDGNGKWDEYMAEFNEKYPDINVEVQTITDYVGQMKTRMNSTEYGDLLMLPADINPQELPHFFEPLGKTSELSETYLGLNDRAFEGISYGIPTQMNATGMVVNMQVFRDAGIEEFPRTTKEFISALEKIKENDPEVTPLYTNYAAGWTLTNWDFARLGVSGDVDFTNKMVKDSSPFESGKVMNEIYQLLFDVSEKKLIEADPTTSDWEQSKSDMANNKVAVMVLGSWAVPQIQEIVPENASNIVFQAFPMEDSSGKQYMGVGGDYNLAINVNSEHKEAARKLLDWLINESNYSTDNGGLPTVIGAEYPESLQASKDAGVELIEANPAPEGEESLFSDINDSSELGIGSTDLEKQRLIDAAIGNSKESFEDIMKDFNSRWKAGIDSASSN